MSEAALPEENALPNVLTQLNTLTYISPSQTYFNNSYLLRTALLKDR